MAYVDWVFGVLSGRMGWIPAVLAVLCTVGLAVFVLRAKLAHRGRWLAGALGAGLALSVALAAPYALAASRSKSPLGPFEVQRAIAVLPPLAADQFAAPIRMQIWYPTTGMNPRAATANTCAQLQALPLANAENARRLILYMPHFGGVGSDNSQRLSYLASYGYIAVAFDDIALDEVRADAKPEEEDARLFTWHVSTQADYERAMSLSDLRVRLQAEKALSGLNRLGACAAAAPASPWSKTVDYAHVGFLGFSFGGSTAAEAGAIDARIVAVANLDEACSVKRTRGVLPCLTCT